MALKISKDTPAGHVATLLFVATLLLVAFLIDRSYSRLSEAVDFVYVIPLIVAAFLLAPLEILGFGIVAVLMELGTETTTFQKDPVELWTAVGVAAFGIGAALASRYIRRFVSEMSTAKEDLSKSPIAYATFAFPGYDLIGNNQSYEKMLAAGDAKGRSLLQLLPEESASRLRDLMDQAVAGKTPVAVAEFPIMSNDGGRSFWDISIIPAAASSKARPKSVSLFAVDVSDAVIRSRTRDAALRISSSVMASLDLDETLHAVLDSLGHIAQTNAGGLFLIEDDQWVGVAGWGQYTDEMARQLRWPYDDLPTGVDAIESRRAVAIENAASDPRFSTERVLAFKIRSALVVPLISGNRPIGACWLNQTDELRRFTDEQVEFATVIGSHAALAIENASIYENERAMRKSLEAIEAISEIGLATLDLDEVLTELVTRAQDVLQMDAGAILLADEEGKHLEVRAATGISARSDCGLRVPVKGSGLASQTFREGAPVKIDDLKGRESDFCPSHDYEADQCPFSDCHGILSALAVPLTLDGKVAGVLQVGSRKPAAFSVQEWSLIQVLAERASLAVQNSMHHREIQEEIARLALLKDVATACAGLSDMRRIAESALEAIFDRLGCQAASIYYLDRENRNLVSLAFIGHTPELMEEFRQIPLEGDSFIPQVVRERKVIIHDNSEVAGLPEPVRHFLSDVTDTVGRRIYLPIVFKGETVGAMALLFDELRPFASSEVDTFTSIASQLAVAIENTRLEREV